MKIAISDVIVKERVRKDVGALKELEDSIKEFGLINPITLNNNKELIAGYRRLECCKSLGWKEIDARAVTGFTELQEYDIELHENIKRKQFTPLEEAEALDKRKEIYERLYPETKKGQYGTPKKYKKENDILSFSDSTAKVTGFSKRTIERKLELNKLPDSFKERLRSGEKVSNVLRSVKKEKQVAEIKKMKPVEGEFNVIVVDPPWGGPYDPDGLRGAGDYLTMTIDEIKAIELPAAKDCVLWLWGIDLHLKETLEVLEAWGFERKSTLIWDKQIIGLGHWLRNRHEYCFLAVKGKPVFHGESIPSVLSVKRGKHSEKPDDFYELVEKASPYKAKLDYFARKKREGWEVYGDEVK